MTVSHIDDNAGMLRGWGSQALADVGALNSSLEVVNEWLDASYDVPRRAPD